MVGDKVGSFCVDDTFQEFGSAAQKGDRSVVIDSYFVARFVDWSDRMNLPV